VSLGLGGDLELTRAEDGSWWDGAAAVEPGYRKVVAVGAHYGLAGTLSWSPS